MFLVWSLGRSSGVLLGITSLMCGTPVLDRGCKLLCKIFNSSQPRFGGNGILRVKPRVFFYLNLKNSRHTPPYPRATQPELEGWLSLLRDRIFQGSTRNHTQTQASTESNRSFTTHQTWFEVSHDQLLGGFSERQKMEVSPWCMRIMWHRRTWKC